MTSSLPPTLDQILELLYVAQKYQMSSILARIRDCASRCPNLICTKNALRVYSLAWGYGLLEETLLAAEKALEIPMTIDNFEDKLDVIPIPALCQLWKYRQKVLDDLNVNFYTRLSDSGAYQSLVNIDCVEKTGSSNSPFWLDDYLNSILIDPARVDLTTFHLALSSHVAQSSDACEKIISVLGETIREFWADLTTVFSASIITVGLTILAAMHEESHVIHRPDRTSHSYKTNYALKFLPKREWEDHLCRTV